MANDLFGSFGNLGNLGGILGGIAKNVTPKDTPEGKLLSAQSDLSDLQKQENEILLEIGLRAYEQQPTAWPQDAKIKLIRQNMATAQATLNEAKQAQQQAETAKATEETKGRCPSCGCGNPEGVKFCQECGSKLGASFCISCGAELSAGTRFCGGCGARQGD